MAAFIEHENTFLQQAVLFVPFTAPAAGVASSQVSGSKSMTTIEKYIGNTLEIKLNIITIYVLSLH